MTLSMATFAVILLVVGGTGVTVNALLEYWEAP